MSERAPPLSGLDALIVTAAVGERRVDDVVRDVAELVRAGWRLELVVCVRGEGRADGASEAPVRAHVAALAEARGAAGAPPEGVVIARALVGLDGRVAGAFALVAPDPAAAAPEAPALAAFARRLTLVVEQASARALTARLAHRMNNGLAGALANVEFVAELLAEVGLDAETIPEETWNDARSALNHAATSVRGLATLVREVAGTERPPPSDRGS